MTIKGALGTYLRSYAGLIALVGQNIYPQMIPHGCRMPAVSYALINNTRTEHTGVSDTMPEAPRFQIDCWGNYDEADAVAQQVKAALKDYSGTMGGAGGVSVARVLFEEERDAFDEQLKRCGVSLDFIFLLD